MGGGGGGEDEGKREREKKLRPSFAASEYREEGHDRRLVLPLHALHALRKIESALSRSFLLWVGDFFIKINWVTNLLKLKVFPSRILKPLKIRFVMK